MFSAWRRHKSWYGQVWSTCTLAIAALALLAACSGQRELWSNDAAPDQIPSFRQVSPPDLNAVVTAPDGALVAVGGNGTILRSADRGEDWHDVARDVTASTLQHIAAIREAAGHWMLVAVGDNGTIVRAHDGVNWKAIPATGTTKDLRRVLPISPGVLVAIGDQGVIVRSADGGDSWFPVYTNQTATLTDIVAVDSRHLLVAGDAGVMLRSEDGGQIWHVVESHVRRLSQVLVTRSGALVAVGESIERADNIGAAWSPSTVPFTGAFGVETAPFTQVIQTGGGTLVALGAGRKTQYSRDDGRTWNVSASATDLIGVELALTAADGTLAAIGQSHAMRSTDDGASWIPARAPRSGNMVRDALILPDGALLAVGQAGAILKSRDGGASWTYVTGSGTTSRLFDVAAGVNRILIAVGDHGAILRSTDNGTSWTAQDSGRNDSLMRVLSQPAGPWITVGQTATILQSVTGGKSWAPVQAPPGNNELYDLIAASQPGVMVAAGYGGTILRSEDGGASWAAIPSGTEKNLVRLAEYRGVLIAVGDDGTILRSTDLGQRWQAAANSSTDRSLSGIAAWGDVLVACAAGGRIVRSTDLGVYWTPIKNPADALDSVVSGRGSTLVAFGIHYGVNPGITMVRSTDGGLTWALVPDVPGNSLSAIIVQPDGVMVGLGDGVIRSVDDGATWSAVPGTRLKQGLSKGLSAPDGRLIMVGEGGLIVRETARRAAPTIRRVVHSYGLNGALVLRIRLDDPAGLCLNAQCLSAWARSLIDNKSGRAGDRQPPATLVGTSGAHAEYDLKIDPMLASAHQPQPLYLNLVVDVPGHHRVIRNESGGDFEVPNDPTPLWQNPWVLGAAVPFAVLLVLLLISAVRPLWLLSLMKAQHDLENHGFADWLGRGLTLIVKVALPVLSRQPNVLNAWVDLHAGRLAVVFDEAAKKLSDQSLYWALPVTGPDGVQFRPSPAEMGDFFKPKRVFIEIIGQGGAGKTRLALQICAWLTSGRFTTHPPAAALLIDEEFTDIFAVIRAKVVEALDKDAPADDFLKVLLAHGRLWIVIDRVSERQQPTRMAVTRLYQSVSPKVVICTSRQPIEIGGGQKMRLIPEPLNADTILEFVLELLREAKARQLFPDPGLLVRFIKGMAPYPAGNPDMPRVTPLLVAIIVAEAIDAARVHGTAALKNLPTNVPNIYFSYVQRLDETRQDQPAARGATAGMLVGRAAGIIACTELGEDFRPKGVGDDKVHQALMADQQIEATGIDFIDRFVQNGLLSRRTIGITSSVEYLLDPLAECLAAYMHACRCGTSHELWDQLIQGVNGMGAGAHGFMAALRMNHEAYAQEFGFPPVVFPIAITETGDVSTT